MTTNSIALRLRAIVPLALLAMLISVACQPKPESPKGFALPEGDIVKGKTAFIELQCYRCHEITGVELPESPKGKGPHIEVPLGGEVYRVKTYGELVTSIINPTHVISPKYKNGLTDESGKSIMPDHNEKMTVSQMIDLVSFLQARYKLTHPDYDPTYYGM